MRSVFVNTSRRKIAAVAAIVLIPLALLVAVIVLASRPAPQKHAAEQSKWFNQMMDRKECNKRWKQYPVIMISLDGFRADYLKRNVTTNIQWLIEVGSYSPYMYSSYPSKTFPNHYTIVTGLYPESHGIIDNYMYDSTVGSTEEEHKFTMRNAENPQWWLGEPLWNTVQRNGLKSASYFWAGSDKKINGRYPTYWSRFDHSRTYYNRIDKVIQWLTMPDDERPSLINVYFNEPDSTGHEFGPESNEVTDKLIHVDGIIAYLMNSLARNDLIGCVNLIVAADHGMEKMKTDIYLDKYVNLDDAEVFSGPVGRIMLKPGKNVSHVVNVLRQQGLPMRVYTKRDIPKRLHFSASRRIGDVIIDCDPGVKVWRSVESHYNVTGDHGYDFRYPAMHALFVAAGPSVKAGYTVSEPFQNVELYNLVADLLNLKYRAPNNGTDGLMHQMQVNPPEARKQSTVLIEICRPITEPLRNCGGHAQLNLTVPKRRTMKFSEDVVSTTETELCVDANEYYNVLFSEFTEMPVCIWTKIRSEQVIKSVPHYDAVTTSDGPMCADVEQERQELRLTGKGLYPLLPIDHQGLSSASAVWMMSKWKCVMLDSFYQNIWTPLLEMMIDYAKLYGTVASYAGPIFDYNDDGLVDTHSSIERQRVGRRPVPTHFYCILLKCHSTWAVDGGECSSEANALAFILPHDDSRRNETMHSYIYTHTARVRDIELLTGLRFFDSLKPEISILQRLHINQNLWPMN